MGSDNIAIGKMQELINVNGEGEPIGILWVQIIFILEKIVSPASSDNIDIMK